MKVVVLSHSSAVENLGGAERSMLGLIDEWTARDPSVEFFVFARSPEGLLQPELAKRGIKWATLPFNSLVAHRRVTRPEDIFRTSREDFSAVRAIALFLEEWKPDLVLTNTIVAPWAAVAAGLAGVPHVWFPREYGDDHEFQLPPDAVFGDIGILSDLVVTNSRSLSRYLETWIPADKLMVLYPPLDLASMRTRAAEGLPDAASVFGDAADFRIVCVARIARSKGQHRLLAAMAAMRDAGVVAEAALVGPGTPRDIATLRDEIATMGLENVVHLVGEHQNPHPFIAAADVGVVVSDSEGFGRSTFEYMAAGKPVVAFRAGATAELVEHDRSGLLVEPGEIDELADALVRYATDRTVLRAHGTEALRRAEHLVSHHTFDEFQERLQPILRGERAGMTRLPAIMSSWFELPAVSLEYLTEAGATLDPRQELPWRLGTRLSRAARRFRRGAAQPEVSR